LLIGEVGGLIGLIGFLSEFVLSSLLAEYIKNIIDNKDTLGEKSAVFIKFKNEILRPYGLRMTGKG
jgi:hypothetical protein